LGHYGYSRDHRGDRRQILLAVATDCKGVPIHLEVLRGNRADNRTLVGLLATLRRRFGIEEAIFVFDGGMSSRLNLQQMQSQQLHFITRLSAVSLAKLLTELPRDQQPELGDRTQLLEITSQGKRYVIAGGTWRQQRDQERRTARLAKAEAELKRLAAVPRKKVDAQKLASQIGRTLERLKAHKYFEYGVKKNGQIHWQRKRELIQAETKQDGWYVLHTDLAPAQCAGKEVLSHYKELLEVEEAFCQLKSYLEVRPVYHWRPDRVRNHVRICFLAYWLSARLAREWQGKGEKGEVPRLLRQMQKIRVGQLQVEGQRVGRQLMHVSKEMNVLLKKLDLLPLFAQPPDWVPM
jgi:transposase